MPHWTTPEETYKRVDEALRENEYYALADELRETLNEARAEGRPAAAGYAASSVRLEREAMIESLTEIASHAGRLRTDPKAEPIARELLEVQEWLECLRADVDERLRAEAA